MSLSRGLFLATAGLALSLLAVRQSPAQDLPGFTPDPYPTPSMMADPSLPVVVYPRQGSSRTAGAAQSQSSRLLDKAARAGRLRVIVSINYPTPSPSATTSDIVRHASGLRAAQDAVIARVGLTGADRATVDASAIKRFSLVPGFALAADPSTLQRLLADPAVTSIEEDLTGAPSLNVSGSLVGAGALQNQGLTGAGYTIAILDSGTDTKFDRAAGSKVHPMLMGKIKAVGCYSTTDSLRGISSVCPGGVSESTGRFAGANCDLSISGCQHGTHVAGIAAGNMPSLKGIAPGAGLISIQVFSKFTRQSDCGAKPAPCARFFYSDVIKGLERVRILTSAHNIVAANLSINGTLFPSACDSFLPAVTNAIGLLRAAGVAPIVSSGNLRSQGSVEAPACISTAIAVGSTTKTTPETLATDSNHSELVRLLAPGVGIVSARANGQGKPQTIAMSGTSMAAPHVAGAFALLKQAKPSASIEDILNALECTGKPIARGNVPKPRINLVAARDFLVAGKPCSFDIVALDSGSEKDDIFVIKVDGTEICRTPVGGRRECGIKGVGRGNHQLAVFVELAPDNLGTYTVTLGNGVKFSDGTTSRTAAPPQGNTDLYTITVP